MEPLDVSKLYEHRFGDGQKAGESVVNIGSPIQSKMKLE